MDFRVTTRNKTTLWSFGGGGQVTQLVYSHGKGQLFLRPGDITIMTCLFRAECTSSPSSRNESRAYYCPFVPCRTALMSALCVPLDKTDTYSFLRCLAVTACPWAGTSRSPYRVGGVNLPAVVAHFVKRFQGRI